MSARETFDPFIRAWLAIVAAAHVALALFVPDMAVKFQLGDRAWDRTAKIDALLQAPDLDAAIAMLFYNGAPGDYIFFVPVYVPFGAAGVIALNIVLLLLGLWFLYRIGKTWFSPAIARIATVTYALLPATIFHPQVFASEAICNPLLIVAVWYAGRMLTRDTPAYRDALLFGLVASVLVFTRHIYLLFPLMVAGLLLARAGWTRHSVTTICVILAMSFTLAGGWRAANWATEGRYEVAESFHGLDSNLFLRAERMASTSGVELDEEVLRRRAIGLGEFAALALEHPVPLLRTVVSDTVNLTGNTGVSMVYGRYLGLFDLGEKGDADMFKWRDIRDREGTLAMLVFMGRTAPLALIFNVGFALAWLGLILTALAGTWRVMFDGTRDLALRLLLAGVPLYIFVFTFASGSVRWDHRSPMEFVICLFFAAGLAWLGDWQRLRQEEPLLLTREWQVGRS